MASQTSLPLTRQSSEYLPKPVTEQVSGMSRKMRHASFSCRNLQSGTRNKTPVQKPQCKVKGDKAGGLESCPPGELSYMTAILCPEHCVRKFYCLHRGNPLHCGPSFYSSTVAPWSRVHYLVIWPLWGDACLYYHRLLSCGVSLLLYALVYFISITGFPLLLAKIYWVSWY